ncbi:alpha/beta fold hydrolase [Streptomyces sp. NPDC013740]|uniref:alpha/beta fold hydrolase n=1 Tax=Streptomyces sp. NPDC013740 TaxID=3364867 RepID=UPI0036FD326F
MESTVKADGGELRAEDTGGEGLPMVLVHQGVGDSTIWDPVLPALAGRHRVTRYDVRGYGRSPEPSTPYSPAADLSAALDHFGRGRARSWWPPAWAAPPRST